MKILLISGHGAGDSGAVGCGRKEAELTRQATNILDGKFAAYDVIAKRYPVSHDAYQDNRNDSLATHLTDYDLVIEVHFNSYNGDAHGTEVLYKPSAMRSLAAKVSDAIADVGFYDRGAKHREDLMNMNTCARLGVPYILIETCFIDNRPDMNTYEANIYEVWGEVAAAVCKYYGIKKLASAGKPVETTKTSASKKKPAREAKKGFSGTFPVLPKKGYLAEGDEGVQVGRLQRFLKWYGTYKGATDDSFGPLTEKAVRAFQKKEDLKVDGSFGPKSLKKAKAVRK